MDKKIKVSLGINGNFKLTCGENKNGELKYPTKWGEIKQWVDPKFKLS